MPTTKEKACPDQSRLLTTTSPYKPGWSAAQSGAAAIRDSRISLTLHPGYELARTDNQFLFPTRWRDRAGLRDQTLQFRNAGAAIGAGLQLHADLGGRSGARRDGVANRGAADPKAGADDRAGAGQPIDRFARQQHPALIVAEPIRGEQVPDHVPVAGIVCGTDEQTCFDAAFGERCRAIDAAAQILVFGEIVAGDGPQPRLPSRQIGVVGEEIAVTAGDGDARPPDLRRRLRRHLEWRA